MTECSTCTCACVCMCVCVHVRVCVCVRVILGDDRVKCISQAYCT